MTLPSSVCVCESINYLVQCGQRQLIHADVATQLCVLHALPHRSLLAPCKGFLFVAGKVTFMLLVEQQRHHWLLEARMNTLGQFNILK